ncbi:cellulose biosynthesis cyclic di-GMP-binding regulatory protein BcsB [Aeromonas sp. FDAARGOS 1409]|uniref:cellulose biosynthesis cyclic di-GMP-binding regulatory protein BcsB n=1 Tax=Aeromonas TaxID=642 RepID=UPI001C21E21D|nr:cellulose biosynthesis cyclic di-GMP-binding regulatory protein BcsB [Aeromonas sp. FDAARGOS 1409]QXC31930.1 cellulose biosynthesis cyclic di-GMP-binding regulatory protein BcsB [Aeromonas sp. FDAARGOS 1409]
MMKPLRYLIPLLLMAQGATADEASGPRPQVPAPVRSLALSFEQMASAPGTLSLRGNAPDGQADFTVRRDEVVTRATLDLDFTPSPSLLPLISQVKVYLNDELMGVTALTKEQMGERTHARIELDPRYAKDFNRIKVSFVGHYQKVCENPASDTLWLNVNRDSKLSLQLQTLPVRNELSFFPMPFLDMRDNGKLILPMVFSGAVPLEQQQAAAVLASWFGTRAQWRGQHFPVLINRLPDRNGVIFATNDARPDFLADYPEVKGPTIDMISSPDNPYVKLLLILGRDQQDLLAAVSGLARGEVLLRGQSVRVDEVKPLAPRQPYDAPNWVRLDRKMRFDELTEYPGQLQATGRRLWPMSLTLRLPPDLYLLGESGIRTELKYHHSAPTLRDGSRLDVAVNGQFMKSFPLEPGEVKGERLLTLPLWFADDGDATALRMPGLKTTQANNLSFSFEYAQQYMGGTEDGRCDLVMPPAHQVRIDEASTIDFTGYRHFIEMPNLRAFSYGGFPFSRMADLADSQVVMPARPHPEQITTLLDTLGAIGAETGYPALSLRVLNDWEQARTADLDTLLIGTLPEEFRRDPEPDALLQATRSWVNEPTRQHRGDLLHNMADRQPQARVGMTGNDAIAVILGLQSPTHDQRSLVALLADGSAGVRLLNDTLQTPAQRDQVAGSVTLIRESGVKSLEVGERYELGYLPWWERLWQLFARYPLRLAGLTLVCMLVLGWGLRVLLASASRRRLKED